VSSANKLIKIAQEVISLIKPLGDRVVVELEKQEEKSAFGIVLPDSAKEKPSQGRVVAVGNGSVLESGERSPMELAVGDLVIFSQYGGSEVKYNGVEYLILRESDILAVVE